jgi:histidyl-tRNA synthetase
MQRGMVTVKQLRDGEGAQAERAIDAVADWAAQLRA